MVLSMIALGLVILLGLFGLCWAFVMAEQSL